jgi:hypothetical protein
VPLAHLIPYAAALDTLAVAEYRGTKLVAVFAEDTPAQVDSADGDRRRIQHVGRGDRSVAIPLSTVEAFLEKRREEWDREATRRQAAASELP